jgi:hypothetical protein
MANTLTATSPLLRLDAQSISTLVHTPGVPGMSASPVFRVGRGFGISTSEPVDSRRSPAITISTGFMKPCQGRPWALPIGRGPLRSLWMPHLPLRNQTSDAPHGDGQRQSGTHPRCAKRMEQVNVVAPTTRAMRAAIAWSRTGESFIFSVLSACSIRHGRNSIGASANSRAIDEARRPSAQHESRMSVGAIGATGWRRASQQAGVADQ